ncbi:RNA 2',3'-cyclic phosphodiesterase [Nitrososphaera viennensis]|uniref:RNA 2',3'-cyclic phosphodiesterase n=2 Tax=Nitrososphaera viennensis TaxID=1034015 RepID=A0A060HTK6_9ARCH|nr:RNA 2',3'-cyclic phosphodiesterase [Nitrososphaera viennensis]AIC16791.1 putative 2'-5' RNA ligase [Nitrososphaera viennensis EN76]UVS68696.1 RNA 2',3'-cyclic phosphodiesterase [Nitrososphaera viennensis]
MRAFVAVDAPGSEIAGLQQEMTSSSGWSPREVKPVEPNNFHFTLIFLGEITGQQAEKVRERLAGIKFEPFPITYTGVGAFPKASNARVVWVGLDREGAARLEALAGQVVARMAEAGFVQDKPFSPHLTIFRAKNRHVAVDVARYAGRTFGTSVVDRVHLKKSDLAPSGPTYSNIYTVSAAKEKGA